MSETQKQQLQSEIEHTREQLGETVEELAARADVKTRLHEKLEERKAAVRAQPAVPVGVIAGIVLLVALLAWRRRSGE